MSGKCGYGDKEKCTLSDLRREQCCFLESGYCFYPDDQRFRKLGPKIKVDLDR